MSLPVDEYGKNAFHLAAEYGSVKLLQSLLSSTNKAALSASLAARDSQKRLPAHVAAEFGNLRVLKLLLQHHPEAAAVRGQNGYRVPDLLRFRPALPDLAQRERLVGFGNKLASLEQYLHCENVADFAKSLSCFKYPTVTLKHSIAAQEASFMDKYVPFTVVQLELKGKTPTALVQCINEPGVSRVVQAASSESKLPAGKLGAVPFFKEISLPFSPSAISCFGESYVACTKGQCFTWGDNKHGQLGRDLDDTTYDIEPIALDDFIEFNYASQANSFTALQSSATEKEPVHPLKGCVMAATFCVAFTKYKLYAWGKNYGQMMKHRGKNSEEPKLVFDSQRQQATIEQVACTNGAIAILLSTGSLILLRDFTFQVLKPDSVSEVRACGKYLVILSERNKLQQYCLGDVSDAASLTPQTVWSSKYKSVDDVSALDVAVDGKVVFATAQGVHLFSTNRSTQVISGSDGLQISILACSQEATLVLGINRYEIDVSVPCVPDTLVNDLFQTSPFALKDHESKGRSNSVFDQNEQPISRVGALSSASASDSNGKVETVYEDFRAVLNNNLPLNLAEYSIFGTDLLPATDDIKYNWENPPAPALHAKLGISLVVGHRRIQIHPQVLRCRCPRVAQALDNEDSIGVGADIILSFESPTQLRFTGIDFQAVVTFVHYVYTGLPNKIPNNVKMDGFRELKRLVVGSLASGLVKVLEEPGDLRLNLGNGVISIDTHHYILEARCEYFRARLSGRWGNPPLESLDLADFSPKSVKRLLRFLYTGSPHETLVGFDDDEIAAIYELMELWLCADHFLVPTLKNLCEAALLELTSYLTVLPLMESMPHNNALARSCLQFLCRNLDHFYVCLFNSQAGLITRVEEAYKIMTGKDNANEQLVTLIKKMSVSEAVAEKPRSKSEAASSPAPATPLQPASRRKSSLASRGDQVSDKNPWVTPKTFKKPGSRSDQAQPEPGSSRASSPAVIDTPSPLSSRNSSIGAGQVQDRAGSRRSSFGLSGVIPTELPTLGSGPSADRQARSSFGSKSFGRPSQRDRKRLQAESLAAASSSAGSSSGSPSAAPWASVPVTREPGQSMYDRIRSLAASQGSPGQPKSLGSPTQSPWRKP